MNHGYTKEFKLKHHEAPAKIDLETGEVKQLKKRPNNIPLTSELFEPKAVFKKSYPHSWAFLSKYLTAIEFKVAQQLSLMAKMNTNSLKPLTDETTIPELMQVFGLSKNVISPILKKLYVLGVYGKFEVFTTDESYGKYWIFNPYLSFGGSLIKSDIKNLFMKTHCMEAHFNSNYMLTEKQIKEYKIKLK